MITGRGHSRKGQGEWRPRLLASWLVLLAFLGQALTPAYCCRLHNASLQPNASVADGRATSHCSQKPPESKNPRDQQGSCEGCLATCCDFEEAIAAPVVTTFPIALPVIKTRAPQQSLGPVMQRVAFANQSRAPPLSI